MQATPPWADRQKINNFYLLAAKLTKKTGIPHSVDHIIPLHGYYVCGLNVETNLQVISITDNTGKGNWHESEVNFLNDLEVALVVFPRQTRRLESFIKE